MERRPELHCRTTTGPAGLTMTEQGVDDLVAVRLPEHGSRRAATRRAIPRELRLSRVRLDTPGTRDVPAAPPVRGGVVSRPVLFGRLAGAQRVVQVSAPAGSGKTVRVRSWIAEAGLAERAAWIPVDSQERDPRRFWISVADALRGTAASSALVRPLTASPDLDGWAVVERLLTDLAPLADRVWLVIDDAHNLGPEVLAQLGRLVLRARAEPGIGVATRSVSRRGVAW